MKFFNSKDSAFEIFLRICAYPLSIGKWQGFSCSKFSKAGTSSIISISFEPPKDGLSRMHNQKRERKREGYIFSSIILEKQEAGNAVYAWISLYTCWTHIVNVQVALSSLSCPRRNTAA